MRKSFRSKYARPLARVRNESAPIALGRATAGEAKWQELAKVGEWRGHASGEFALGVEDLAAFVATFDAQENPIPVTYEHPDYKPDGTPVPAAGWIDELEVRGESLWGLVRWTDRAAKMIRDGEYQFCSIVFHQAAPDRVTGETRPELFEVGIVNRPFIDGLQPLAASAHRGAERKPSMKLDIAKITAALSEMPESASGEQMHMALEAAILAQEALEKPKAEKPEEEEAPEMASTGEPPVVEMAATMPVAAAEPMTEAPEAVPEDKSAEAAMQIMGALEKATGLDPAGVLAFVMDNQDAIASMAKNEPKSGSPAEDAALSDVRLSAAVARAETAEQRFAALEAELTEYRAAKAKAEQDALDARVDDAIKAGHILPAHRDTFIKLGRLSSADLEAELARVAKAPQVPTGRLVAAAPLRGGTVDGSDPAEAGIRRKLSGHPEHVIKKALEIYWSKQGKLNGRA